MITKTPRTYVLYTDENDKLAATEEQYFENIESSKVQELLRQTFLFPSIESIDSTGDLAELIPDNELRASFIQKSINAKLQLYVSRKLKEVEQVKVVNAAGEETVELRPTFEATEDPIDLTPVVGEKPKRERLSQDAKINRLLSGMSKEDKAKFLQDMLAAMQAEDGE